MTDPTHTKPSTADRFIKSGIVNLGAFGAVYLAVRLFLDGETPSDVSNLARILGGVLPIVLICSALLLVAGLVMKAMKKDG